MANTEYLLQMKNIVKTFPGVRALDGAAITVKPGEVVALCGENGAGKSTLMKCLYGSYHADEGEIIYMGQRVDFKTPDEGKEACELFADYPRLRYATKEQLVDFTTDEFGIHWEELDEDLSFEGFFEKQEPAALYQLFMAHPELNVSALARRMGISQSLMAQYISGKKNASKARMALILDTIHTVGRELAAV